MRGSSLDEIKELPIREVAARLNIKTLSGNKTMCFGGHDKRTPSLSFRPAKNSWKCFGCGLGGSVIDLVMQARQIDFDAALDWLAVEFGVNVRRDRSARGPRRKGRSAERQPSESAPARATPDTESGFAPDPELYTWFLNRCSRVSQPLGLNYLRTHGISTDVADRFGVREPRDPVRAFRSLVEHWGPDRLFRSGLAFGRAGKLQRLIWPTYTLLFPFYQGGVVGYVQGRQLAGEPKFPNPKEIRKPLYNLDRIQALPPGSVVHICEGVPGALALESLGRTAVATLGASSFRAEWVEPFLPLDIVLMPDGDRGGDTFRRTISKFFAARGKAVRVVRPLPGKHVADVAAAMRGTA